MKKVLLSIAFMAGVGCLSASAQVQITFVEVPNLFLGNCPANSATITTTCGSKCFSSVAIRDGAAVLVALTEAQKVGKERDEQNICNVIEQPVKFSRF